MNLQSILIPLGVILIVPLLCFSVLCCFKRNRGRKEKSEEYPEHEHIEVDIEAGHKKSQEEIQTEKTSKSGTSEKEHHKVEDLTTEDDLKTNSTGKLSKRKEREKDVIDFGVPKGNRNLGNTCFFNSALQALFHTKSFGNSFHYLKEITTRTECHDLMLAKSIFEWHLTQSTRSEDNSKELRNVLKAIGKINNQFNRGTQEDSYDLLNTLVSGVFDEVASLNGVVCDEHAAANCFDIRKLFTGWFINVYEYESCSHTEFDFEKFTSLSIPVAKNSSVMGKLQSVLQTVADVTESDVEKGLSILTQVEEFEEKDLPCRICNEDGEKNVSRRMLLYHPPPVLFIHIDRFKIDGSNVSKNSVQCRFSRILHLAKFCSPMNAKISEEDLFYELYAVIVHSGAIHGGHYYAFVKTTRRHDAERWQRYVNDVIVDEAVLNQEKERIIQRKRHDFTHNQNSELERNSNDVKSDWYYVSDQTVNKVSEEEVMNHKDAYILFYEVQ